jgi:hypothetical protein
MRRCLATFAATATLLAFAGCGEVSGIEVRHLAPFEQALRPDDPTTTDSYRFDESDTVVTYDSPGGGFRIHYTTAGRNAVPAADVTGDPGVPDFVEDAGAIYDEVLAFYAEALGFLAPLGDAGVVAPANDGRFDVYLVDFGSGADGAFRVDGCLLANADQCIGYMIQENDFVGFGYPSAHVAIQILASHELFHAIQAAYDANQGPILGEGTATWATEQYDPALDDLEAAVGGYLAAPDHAINVAAPGPVNAFNYGTSLFFQFLSERFGVATVRRLLERTVNGTGGQEDPDWYASLPQLLTDTDGTTFDAAWLEFATWNLYTSTFADPTKGYAHGADYPPVALVTVPAPHTNVGLRVAHSAAEYYKVLPAGRATMTAALAGPAEELADLHLILAVNKNGRWAEVVALDDLEAGEQTASTDGARNLVVAVVNSSTDTASRHPGFCVGTTDEVAACKASLAPTPPDDTAPVDDGCGCNTNGAGAAWLLGLLVALRRIRRLALTRARQS